jgi:hypothetical protein
MWKTKRNVPSSEEYFQVCRRRVPARICPVRDGMMRKSIRTKGLFHRGIDCWWGGANSNRGELTQLIHAEKFFRGFGLEIYKVYNKFIVP